MKVFISVDLEGIAGVVTPKQAGVRGKEYEMAVRLMVGETNAAIEGAFDAGATEVVVNDSHGNMTNLVPDEVDPRALLVTGPTKINEMMEGIDDSFDCAMLVGYHARARTRGVLSHTFIGSVVHELKIDGRVAGETLMNAGIAGHYGVPIVLVTGDSAVAAEARELIPGVETVVVKYPAGSHAALNISPERARAAVKKGAARAVARAREIKPLVVEPPVRFELTFVRVTMADGAGLIPGVERVDDLTVAYTGQTYIEAFGCFVAMALVSLNWK